MDFFDQLERGKLSEENSTKNILAAEERIVLSNEFISVFIILYFVTPFIYLFTLNGI